VFIYTETFSEKGQGKKEGSSGMLNFSKCNKRFCMGLAGTYKAVKFSFNGAALIV